MSQKIKHTKTELKAQREALARFERFLPMLQLRKQQLQLEILHVDARISEKKAEEDALHAKLRHWSRLFTDPTAIPSASQQPFDPAPSAVGISQMISLADVKLEEGNIAGVAIPILKDVVIRKDSPDLFLSPTWYDDALDVLESLMRLRAERETLLDERRLIAEELRVTSQRVNLFEKVKIPECRENIRVIKIFLGDEQTASVIRAKIAKSRTQSYQYDDVALSALALTDL